MVRGRFAPSPTGPLHFGSLIAAVGSFLNVRASLGTWLIRIEDLDPPREPKGSADDILRTLEAFDLHWDESVSYQSRQLNRYREILDQLTFDGEVYPCKCSRREINKLGLPGMEGARYPGTCRNAGYTDRDASLRLKTNDEEIRFDDICQGPQQFRVFSQLGDFIVRRRDGLFAYQLAVVVDDADSKITEVVRGADLLNSTPRQIHLQRFLSLPTPAYLHLPIAVNAAGAKLSKQTGAHPVDIEQAPRLLYRALKFLGQAPPAELLQLNSDEILNWGIGNWQTERIPAQREIGIANE